MDNQNQKSGQKPQMSIAQSAQISPGSYQGYYSIQQYIGEFLRSPDLSEGCHSQQDSQCCYEQNRPGGFIKKRKNRLDEYPDFLRCSRNKEPGTEQQDNSRIRNRFIVPGSFLSQSNSDFID